MQVVRTSCLLLILCVSLLCVRHTCSDSAQRRVFEDFDQDADLDESPFQSDQELDAPPDNGEYIDTHLDTSDNTWNEGDEEDREYKPESDDEGKAINRIINID